MPNISYQIDVMIPPSSLEYTTSTPNPRNNEMAKSIEYRNPIVPGFAPDPSVVVVDGTFFLVNSSFHVFPGLPIYASHDLMKWTQIGNAINRPSQKIFLKDANSVAVPIGPQMTLIATTGLLAPTIRWHNGTFYIICTNAAHTSDGQSLDTRNFYVTTKDIWSGTWSDPIFYDFQGIDPSIFFDDDGRAYIQGSWREGSLLATVCTIRQLEIDIDTGVPLSETKEIWKGFGDKTDAEGPHIYKKDEYYFLVTAEAGTFEHHMITVARSKNIWGPYESYEKNPILTAFGTKEYVQNTGHGDLFQDKSGAWWLTCLGIRNDNGRYPLGRETFLTPVSWPKDGWPTVENATISFRREGLVAASSSDFELTQLKNLPRIDYLYIRDPNLEDYHFSTDDRRITITPSNSTLSAQLGTSSFVGKRQRALNCSAVVSLDISLNMKASGKSIQTGLALYKEDCRHAEIYYDFSTSAVCFRKELKMKGDAVVSQIPLVAMRNIAFRIRAEPSRYEFEYRVGEEQSWTLLESMDTLEMTGLDFTGPILGIFASCRDVEDAIPIVFEDFGIDS